MATDANRLLRIYMTDQLALGVLWREIARRACNSSNGRPEGAALERVAAQISEDVALFEQMMRGSGSVPARRRRCWRSPPSASGA